MAYIDEINALLPDNGVGDITAEDLRRSIEILDTNVGKLGEITEDNKTGYRFYNLSEVYANAGDTGIGAVDLSSQNDPNNDNVVVDIGSDNGAKGNYSIVAGLGTKTSIQSGTALGKFNTGINFFEIGSGTDDLNRKNAFQVSQDGTLQAPDSTLALINTASNDTLVTKEYADSMTFSIIEDTIEATSNQTVFNFFKKASYVQVFGDGLKQTLHGSNPSLQSITIDNNANGGTGLVTVTFVVGQPINTLVEIVCFN